MSFKYLPPYMQLLDRFNGKHVALISGSPSGTSIAVQSSLHLNQNTVSFYTHLDIYMNLNRIQFALTFRTIWRQTIMIFVNIIVSDRSTNIIMFMIKSDDCTQGQQIQKLCENRKIHCSQKLISLCYTKRVFQRWLLSTQLIRSTYDSLSFPQHSTSIIKNCNKYQI